MYLHFLKICASLYNTDTWLEIDLFNYLNFGSCLCMTLSDIYVGYKLASVSYLCTTRVASNGEIVALMLR